MNRPSKILFAAALAASPLVACSASPGENAATGEAPLKTFDQYRIVGGFMPFGGKYDFCLDIPGGQIFTGQKLQIWQCNDWAQAQRFILGPNGSIMPYANPGYCLDVRYDDIWAGVVELAPCNGTAAQNWTISDGSIWLTSTARFPSHMRLDVTSGQAVPGSTIALKPTTLKPQQDWWPFGFSTVIHTQVPGTTNDVVDVYQAQSSPGATLDNYPNHDGDNQSFTFTEHHQIMWHGLCVEGDEPQPCPGGQFCVTNVSLQNCNNTNTQHWTIGREWFGSEPNGSPALVNGQTDYEWCLDVNGDNPRDGTSLDMWHCNSTYAQYFDATVTQP